MGTHPIFESDFDCLTEKMLSRRALSSSVRWSSQLRFDGKVAIVTGAGAGLGKEYALQFASRGAHVVVNDLGGARDGDGSSTAAADEVVNFIKSKGGKATANYNSVTDGADIVKTAVDAYGKVDIVINNAGILRDRSLLRISPEDWQAIIDVHMTGAFNTSQAAFEHMKKNKFGRFIYTSSAAGIYGNFGQANYSAAKLGLNGLSNTIAIEGAKYNITSNTIAPIAASRLTEDILPPDILEMLKPEYVAPLVLYLCHESCTKTAGLFECGGGWAAELRRQRSTGGLFMGPDSPASVENVAGAFGKITQFDDVTYPETNSDSTMQMIEQCSRLEQGEGPDRD